jgi:dTDP-4-dehydrorhamnose reductase
MVKKILILGANGVLGSKILYQLSFVNNVQITATTRKTSKFSNSNNSAKINLIELDVLDFLIRPDSYNLGSYDIVINAIGAIKQKNISGSDMFLINSAFPAKIANVFNCKNTRVIHFSTDCVFKGEMDNLKTESTPHDAIDDYGKSKSLGEIKQDNFWILRASFIGQELSTNYSLLNWFLNQEKGAVINGFSNQIWNGITAVHYGMIIRKMIEYSVFPKSRILHLIPDDKVSKYDLLKLLQLYFNRNDIMINSFLSNETIFRQIYTEFPEQNLELWNLIDIVQPPRIKLLIEELSYEYSMRRN